MLSSKDLTGLGEGGCSTEGFFCLVAIGACLPVHPRADCVPVSLYPERDGAYGTCLP